MADVRISRRQVLVGAGTLGLLGPALAPAAALAEEDGDGQRVKLLRWDLIAIRHGVVLAGGTDVSVDNGTGDTIELTGSGQAEPREDEGEANGGGTFVHHRATEVIRGAYYVTGFNSWLDRGGSLAGLPLHDGVGELNETSGGNLSVNVKLVPDSGPPHDGVLTIFCHAPGASGPDDEGVTLSVNGTPFNFTQDPEKHGVTLFHILRRGDD
jgi:hypothetical protein